jgi:hypothetical protein
MKSSLIIIFLLLPFITLAGGGTGFTPLIGIPGIQETGDINSYVNALYGLAISIAALIAVVKIVIAGAKYMMDDIVTRKSEAKEDIKNSLIGLLIIIGAWIILATVNSDLTNLSLNTERAFTDQSVPAFIDRVALLTEQSIERNTRLTYAYCNDFWDQSKCIEACRDVYRGEMDYDGRNSCAYLEDTANQCNPQLSPDCCITIKGGTWENNTCGGLTEAQAMRIAACYEYHKTWDEVNDTCRTNSCNRQTDQRCCESYNGTYTNGSCSIDDYNEEQDDENGTQDYQASQCVTIDQGLWNYNTGQCTSRDDNYGYEVISNQLYIDPNGNPQEVCESLSEQMGGVDVEYLADIRSCRWNR